MPTTTNVPRMDDASLVGALRGGDTEAFARIYDAYADRLFAYAVTLVRDRDVAADVVHDTFLLAHDRIGQLRDPTRLRSWLYAITRSQAMRVIRSGPRHTEFDSTIDVTDHEIRLDRSLEADEARLLVAAALAGLNDGDREVVELSLRHELDVAAIAAAMGQTSSYASARISRAKQQFDLSMSAVLLLRSRGRDCSGLREVIGEESALTPLLRKRIARHLEGCEACTKHRRAAIAVLPGVAMALPITGAPDSLRTGLVTAAGHLRGDAVPLILTGTSPTLGADGFPIADASRRRRWIIAAVIAGLLALLLVGVVGASVLAARDESAADAEALPVPTETATTSAAPTPSAPSSTASTSPPTPGATTGEGEQGAAVEPPPTQPTTARPVPTRTRAPAPSSPPPPPLVTPAVAVSWSDVDPNVCGKSFDVRVTVTVTGAAAKSVTAKWRSSSGTDAGSVALVRTSNQNWQGVLVGLPGGQPSDLTVKVVTSQGVTVTTSPESVTDTCGS